MPRSSPSFRSVHTPTTAPIAPGRRSSPPRAWWLAVALGLAGGGCAGEGPVDPGTTDPVDGDGDGILASADCDDSDPARGGPEVPADGVDNDCDGATDCDDPDSVEPWWGDLTTEFLPGFCDDSPCRSVSGRVLVDGTPWTDLSALSCLTAVDGDSSSSATSD